jgi:hypothetical protein
MSSKMPIMVWDSANVADTFKFFKQKLNIYFQIKEITGEKQIPYILQAVDDEGLRRYNSWTLTAEEKKKPDSIWTRFEQ